MTYHLEILVPTNTDSNFKKYVESEWQRPVIAYYSVVIRLQTMREIASLISFFGCWLVLAGWMQWNFYTRSPLRHFFRLEYCEYAQDN